MNRHDIVDAIKDLSRSQGFYGRTYEALKDLHDNDPDKYEEVMTELEAQNFGDVLDLVLYLEA